MHQSPENTGSKTVKTAAVFVIIALALGMLEVTARVALYFGPELAKLPGVSAVVQIEKNLDPYEVPDEKTANHWRLRPGYGTSVESLILDKKAQGKFLGAGAFANDASTSKSDTRSQEFQVNSDGYRGPEIEKPKRRRRILMLGDSVTFGLAQTSYPRIAQEAFDRLGESYEVINGGVEGYSTTNLRLEMPRYLSLKPDIVTIFIGWNNLFSQNPFSGSPENTFATIQALNILKRLPVMHTLLGKSASSVNYGSVETIDERDDDLASLAGYAPPVVMQIAQIANTFRQQGVETYILTLPGLFVTSNFPNAKALKVGHLPRFTQNPLVLAALVDAFNAAIRKHAEDGEFSILDVAEWSKKALVPRENYFSDSVHLTGEALRMLGEFVAMKIADLK